MVLSLVASPSSNPFPRFNLQTAPQASPQTPCPHSPAPRFFAISFGVLVATSKDDGIRPIPTATSKRTFATAHSNRIPHICRWKQHHFTINPTLVPNIPDSSITTTPTVADTASQHVSTTVCSSPTAHALWDARNSGGCHGCHGCRVRVFVSIHAVGSQSAAVTEDVGRWCKERFQGWTEVSSAIE